MNVPDNDVIETLCELEPGDTAILTVERDGEELELNTYVTDGYHEQPEKRGFGYLNGELVIELDTLPEDVDRLELASHSLTIMATQKRPTVWDDFSFTIWDPVTDDGEVVEHKHSPMGEITDVEIVEDGED